MNIYMIDKWYFENMVKNHVLPPLNPQNSVFRVVRKWGYGLSWYKLGWGNPRIHLKKIFGRLGYISEKVYI